ncbi:MAG: M67 family metallopeptidase [Actinomycetota bacterium]|nr:M67 family metallopeptidase [Actinomycetota bacterium]
MDTFTISQELVDRIVAHARQEAPHEVCGMLGGSGVTATRVYLTDNPDASALTYSINPREAFSVIRQMRDDGVDFIAVYHSHPATEAYPSPTDRAKAGDSDLIYVIVSLRRPDEPEIRAFKMRANRVDELQVVFEL